MIPLIWLKYAKIAGPLVLILALFFAGWYTKGKIVEARIQTLKHEYALIEANYNSAVEIIDTCQENFAVLEAALKEQNEAFNKLQEDSERRVAQAEEMRRIALANAAKAHENAMSELHDDYVRLYGEWSLLTASDACHEAWVEITK